MGYFRTSLGALPDPNALPETTTAAPDSTGGIGTLAQAQQYAVNGYRQAATMAASLVMGTALATQVQQQFVSAASQYQAVYSQIVAGAIDVLSARRGLDAADAINNAALAKVKSAGGGKIVSQGASISLITGGGLLLLALLYLGHVKLDSAVDRATSSKRRR